MPELPRLKPLHVFDHQAVNRLVVDLNNILARMRVTLPKEAATKADLSGYVRTVDLPGLVQTFVDNSIAQQTSEGSGGAGGVGSSNPTTGPGSPSQQDAQAAVVAAVAINAPPFIATVSALGTTGAPNPRFALEDHTHGGSLDFRQVFMAPKRDYTIKQPVQGTFGDSGNVAQITVDRVGRVTSVTNIGIVASSSDAMIRHSLGLVPKGEKTTKQPVQGTYGSSSQSAVVTVDRLGRIESITTAAITATTTDLGYRRGFFAAQGDVSSKRPVQGSYGSTTAIPVITVDRLGRVTAATTAALATGAAFRTTAFAQKGRHTSKHPVAGAYGDAQTIPVVTVDQEGRIISITTTSLIASSQPVDVWWGNIRITDSASQTSSTGVQALNMTITASSFGASAADTQDASHGKYLEYTSNGASATARAGFFSSNAVTRLSYKPLFHSNARSSASALTSQRIWAGISTNIGSSLNDTDTPAATHAVHYILFRASSVAGDTTWKLCSGDGTTDATPINTGVSFATNTVYRFRIDAADPTSVKCYINETLVATATSNLPSTAQNLAVTSASYNTTTSAQKWGIKSIDIYEQIK